MYKAQVSKVFWFFFPKKNRFLPCFLYHVDGRDKPGQDGFLFLLKKPRPCYRRALRAA